MKHRGRHSASRQHRDGSAIAEDPLPRGILVIVEPRPLLRECLAAWMGTVCPDFRVVSLEGTESKAAQDTVTEAALVILSASDRWASRALLAEQIKWVRHLQNAVPIALIGDESLPMAEELLNEFELQGYIPMTSASEVAAAALRLIVAGGAYIPFRPSVASVQTRMRPFQGCPVMLPEAPALLTRREQIVLQCLRRGLPNKIIAYELGLSIGTVKLHVHNIIFKLKVHNRTEAALTRHLEPPALLHKDGEAAPLGSN